MKRTYHLGWVGSFDEVEHRLIGSKLLDEWQTEPGGLHTQLVEDDQVFWLSFPPAGAIRFDLFSRSISAYPKAGVESQVFERFLVHDWLPLVYQAWGYQVLHASAAVHLASGVVVAFTGDTGKGKSTLGYGLGVRPGWRQIADDSLAFTRDKDVLHLSPIPNAIRLRPDSASYFSQPAYSHEILNWPDTLLNLDYILFIDPILDSAFYSPTPVHLEHLNSADAYPFLLKQAYALTLKLPGHNRRLLQDYLELTRQVRAYRLVYHQSFSVIEEILEIVERQAT